MATVYPTASGFPLFRRCCVIYRRGTAVAVPHCALHLVDIEVGVEVHHRQIDALTLRSESLDANALEPPVRNRFVHLLEVRARQNVLHEEVGVFLAVLHFMLEMTSRSVATRATSSVTLLYLI